MVAVGAPSHYVKCQIYFCICFYLDKINLKSPSLAEQSEPLNINCLFRAHLMAAEALDAF